MSHTIQDDQEVIKNGRSKFSEEDISVPLKDRIDFKLVKKLNDDNFGFAVIDAWHKESGNRTEWLERQKAYLADWDQFLVSDSEGPFSYGSNLHLPTTFTILKTYHSRLFAMIRENFPAAKPRTADSVERTQSVHELLKYAVKDWANNNEGLLGAYGPIDRWVWEILSQGVSTLKQRWDIQYEKFMDVEETLQPELEFVKDPSDPEGDGLIPRQKVNRRQREVQKVVKTYEGPNVEVAAEEDLIIVGGGGDPQKADMVLHQQFLTAHELWTMAETKIFDASVVKEIISGGSDKQTGHDGASLKQIKASASGKAMIDEDSESALDRYRIIECYALKDVDGTGIGSQIVGWIHAKTGKILRATYLRRINRAGKRPFVRTVFHERHGETYPIGLVEILYPYSKEIDFIHNMRMDSGIISNMPVIFYRAGSSINPETMRYEPGSMIPVDDPTDIFIPQFGNKTQFGLQEEAGIMNVIERLTSISELNLGVLSSKQGATRTASGSRILASEGSANFDIHVHRVMSGWKKLFELLIYTLQDRVPADLTFRIQGNDGQDYWGYIRNRDDIAGNFLFELDISLYETNPAARADRAFQIFSGTLNPLLIQTGIVTQRNIYEAYINHLKAQGIKDWAKYATEPKGMPLIMMPEEELNRVVRGISVPVSLEMDHEGFINLAEELFNNPQIFGSLNQMAVEAIFAQRQEHERALQALKSAQAQQANLQQMQLNAQASAVQSPAIPQLGGAGGGF